MPEFFKGPVYTFYREQHKFNNKNKYISDGFYDYVSYNPKGNLTKGKASNSYQQPKQEGTAKRYQPKSQQKTYTQHFKDEQEDEDEDDDDYGSEEEK